MRAGCTDRPVDQCPLTIDPVWQDRSIFVLRLHDHSIAVEMMEIIGERHGYTRPSSGIRGIDDGIPV